MAAGWPTTLFDFGIGDVIVEVVFRCGCSVIHTRHATHALYCARHRAPPQP